MTGDDANNDVAFVVSREDPTRLILTSTGTINNSSSPYTGPIGVTNVAIRMLGGDDSVLFSNKFPIHLAGNLSISGGDGANTVTMAMNGGGREEPAWWLNLQAHPEAEVALADGVRRVTGRPAVGDERERLWARWAEIDKNLDGFAALRPRETAVVLLEPRIERR